MIRVYKSNKRQQVQLGDTRFAWLQLKASSVPTPKGKCLAVDMSQKFERNLYSKREKAS